MSEVRATTTFPNPCRPARVAGREVPRTTGCYRIRDDGVKKRWTRPDMITETTTELAPHRVLAEARRFFTEEDALSAATIVDESDRHVTLATFRSRLAISAWREPEGTGTRVRVSTLRRHDAVGKFLSWLESESATE